jgi:hypothetical protein
MPKKEKHWGIVIDNRDPEYRGRLVVQCDTIAEGDVLEWIEPSFHFVDSNDDVSAGSFWVPNAEAIVEVEIEAEEDSEALGLDPRWKCCLYSEGQVPEEFAERNHYPNRRGWKTRAGHVFYFDDTENEFTFYYEHPSGAKITVDHDGNIRLDTEASVYIGRDADHPISRGDILETLLDNIVAFQGAHIHSSGSFTTPLGTGGGGGPVTGASGSATTSEPSVPGDLNSDDHKVD